MKVIQEFTFYDTGTDQEGTTGAMDAVQAAISLWKLRYGRGNVPQIWRDGFLVICGPIEVFDPNGGV
jgi:hypothetical protein